MSNNITDNITIEDIEYIEEAKDAEDNGKLEPPSVKVVSLDRSNIDVYLEAIAAIERSCFALPWSAGTYKGEMINPRANYLAVICQDRLVAYAGYWLVFDEGDINNVAVRQDFRGLGLGKKLMQDLIAHCKSKGGKRMTLEVRESNDIAISLYESLGFVSAGLRSNYYEDNHESAAIMWLDIE